MELKIKGERIWLTQDIKTITDNVLSSSFAISTKEHNPIWVNLIICKKKEEEFPKWINSLRQGSVILANGSLGTNTYAGKDGEKTTLKLTCWLNEVALQKL